MLADGEWTVEVETCDGLAASDGELDRFSGALLADGRLKEPLAVFHPERGAFSVVFDVEAEAAADAAALAEEAVVAAIARANIVARGRTVARIATMRLS